MQIFLSYSRKDYQRWFENHRLIPFLQESLKRDKVHLWYDLDKDGLRAGEEFREKIETAINDSAIAILLISHNFLNSDFIEDVELPLITKREKEGLLRIVPILVDNCDYKSVSFLGKRHILPAGQPLIDFVRDEVIWEKARAKILAELKRDVREIGSGSAKSTTLPSTTEKSVEPPIPTPDKGRSGLTRRQLLMGTGAATLLVGGGALFLGTRRTMSTTPVLTLTPERAKDRDAFFGALPWLNWLIYDPSEYDPIQNRFPSEASIRTDIRLLRQHGFNGLVTTSSKGSLRLDFGHFRESRPVDSARVANPGGK